MGLVAAFAVAVSACCAAAATGGVTILDWHLPIWLYVAGMLPGLACAAVRGPTWVRPRGKTHDTLFSLVLIASGVFIVSGFAGRGASTSTGPTAAAAMAVILLSLYWPDPPALALAVVSSLVYLVTSAGDTTWTVGAVGAGAFAAVTTATLHRAHLPTYGAVRSGWRQTGRDSAMVLVVAAIFGALLVAVAPSPPPSRTRSEAAGDQGPATLAPLGLAPGLNLAESRKQADDTIVFRIAAPEADAWRAGTYETWTGRSWRFSAVSDTNTDPGGSQDLRVPLQPGEVVDPAHTVVQKVTIETDSAQVIVGAPVPTRVISPRGSYVISYAGVLVEGPAIPRHSTYVVESSRASANEATLRQSDPMDGTLPAEISGYAAPPPADAGVGRLAQQITAGAPTVYDKTVAIERWLSENMRLKATDSAVPRGRDVVSQFLFVDRGGRVERVATAMVVMLRTLGIPSRLAVGFRPGERSGATDAFAVRASDATAWAEVWFPGAGWQRFDSTGSLTARQAAMGESLWSRLWSLLKQVWPALVVAASTLVVWFVVRKRLVRKSSEPIPWATRFYARLLRAGTKRHRPVQPHETPVEYTTALAASVLPDARLIEVGELVTAAAYSGRAPSADQQVWAETVLKEATAATPAKR
ncbi:MAG: DUF3488 and transglutaminase-like domain-containing protein [Actinomycetota bacterium]|nr:DUF3488 and transglutaminase-like domain-containing protein [Actinomycetota bacterium]